MYQAAFQVPYTQEWKVKSFFTLEEAKSAIDFYQSFCRFSAHLLETNDN